jgi:hypothetical protein
MRQDSNLKGNESLFFSETLLTSTVEQ